jgi:hypothetical protein
MEEIRYNIGDLVYVLNDSYIFRNDKAYLVQEGMCALVVEIVIDEMPLDYFSEGRKSRWLGSVRIHDEFGRTGWIHAANIILLEEMA